MNIVDTFKRTMDIEAIKEMRSRERMIGIEKVYGGSREIQTKTPSYLREKRPANTWNDKVKLATYYPKHGLPREMTGVKPDIHCQQTVD